MTETVVLDPTAVSTARTEVDITDFISTAGVDWGDAEIQAVMADQTYGSSVLDYRLPNRHITMGFVLRDLEVTYDQIVTLLQQKVSKFQFEGGWIMRNVDGFPLYADIANATLHLGGSWLSAFRGVDIDAKLDLECSPDFYGDEITLDIVNGIGDISTVLKLGGVGGQVEGNYPGRVRVQVTDASGQNQHGLIWGLRQRYYDNASSAALVYEAEALKAAPGATVGAVAGTSGGSAVTFAGLLNSYTDVLLLQQSDNTPLKHFGSYRVWARCISTATPNLKLQWGVGNTTPLIDNSPVTMPGSNAPYLIDFGQVRIDRMPIAPHSWTGKIQATGSGNITIDKVYLQPISEFSGRLSVPYTGSWSDVVVLGNNVTEIRSEGAYRQYGTNWGPIRFISGDLPRLPVGGAENSPTELFAKITRGDFLTQSDSGLDSFNVQVKYRPCYLYRP